MLLAFGGTKKQHEVAIEHASAEAAISALIALMSVLATAKKDAQDDLGAGSPNGERHHIKQDNPIGRIASQLNRAHNVHEPALFGDGFSVDARSLGTFSNEHFHSMMRCDAQCRAGTPGGGSETAETMRPSHPAIILPIAESSILCQMEGWRMQISARPGRRRTRRRI